ncbi:hypothetical protein [Paenibacillus sp. ATY16]|uniref:hypothetical protein n=1 Tax=Paenibacillus sp. ATY16 TaxID=1759312 RepID=UPI000E2FC80F|nr:hypothetical protein [Paenibacillus sp. ATY16]MCK9857598.1 hypothetical protein [Paenibacillus sp. ATY16]
MYSARLTKSGVNSWAVEFRHPVLKDREGKQGRKIRRGLGSDQESAQLIVDALNSLLSDEKFWSLNVQKEAKEEFHSKAVEIFYDQMEEDIVSDPWELRNEKIKLPSNDDGYSRVMFLGTTGAGKTTVIRQVIGTEPDEISFPAISSSRTTTCNTEFIFREGNWSGVVTFISQAQAIKLIEECVWEAFRRAVIGEDEKTIAKALLSHPEQRFRLSYLLGQYRASSKQNTIRTQDQEQPEVPYPDQLALQTDIDFIIKEIQSLAAEALDQYTPDEDQVDEAIDKLYESWIREETERFNEVVYFILNLIKSRFELVRTGQLYKDTRGWPVYWFNQSDDKAEVVTMMRWFAGNEGRRFGQLLAPVVNGVRLEGPFQPSWWQGSTPPRLVLVDGEGIGHDSNITTSIPMEVTNKFKEIDAVVLVDNATQPMLDIPKVILREASSRGQQDKMMVVYTRFDQVQGSNMLDEEDRRDHVLGIQTGAIEAMQEAYNLNPKTIRLLRDHLEQNAFFFSNANDLKNPSDELIMEMENFIESVLAKADKPELQLSSGVLSTPIYDYGRLVIAITETEELFMQKWLGLLGLRNSQFPKQHWARIKALSVRAASWPNIVEYNDLKPASDLAGYLMQRLDAFLSVPKEWSAISPEDLKHSVLQRLAETVSDKINHLILRRLKIDLHSQWIAAQNYRDSGSAAKRASEIRSIYEKAIPMPKITYDSVSGDLLEELKTILEDSIKELIEMTDTESIA